MRRARDRGHGASLTARHYRVGEDEAQEISAAFADAVERGGVVAFPTDTVYGIGCDPMQPDAVKRIFALKGRPSDKPLSLLLASVDELLEYVVDDLPLVSAAADEFLPGGLTIVVRRPRFVADEVTSGCESIGLRVPDHALAQALLDASGPVASTSLNLSGEAAYAGVGESPLPAVDLFVDGGPTQRGLASSVVDFTVRPPRMLREGAVTRARFESWLAGR